MKQVLSLLLVVAICFTGVSAALAAVKPGTEAHVANPSGERLNLRQKPSTKAASLGMYYGGTPVTILAEDSDGFAKVTVGNLTGYMMLKYLSYQNEPVQQLPTMFVTAEGINVYESQSPSAKVIATLSKGETVSVWGGSGSWYHIKVMTADGFVVGFMNTKYLNSTKNESGSSSSSDDDQRSESQSNISAIGSAVVNNPSSKDLLNLRASASSSSSILCRFYNGAPVEVLESKGDWAKVRVGSKGSVTMTGYMQRKFLAFDDAQGSVTSAMPRREITNAWQLRKLPELTSDYVTNSAGSDSFLGRNNSVTVLGRRGDGWLFVRAEAYDPGNPNAKADGLVSFTGYIESQLVGME